MKRLITSLNEVTSIADNRFHGFFDEPPRIEFSLRELTKTHLNQNVFDYHLQNKLLGFKTFSFCDTEKVRNGMGYPEDPDISVELTEIHKFCCYRGIDFELFAIIVGFYGLAEYLTLKLSPDYSIWHDQFLKLMMTYYMLKDDKSLIKTLTDFIENHVTHIRDEEKVLSPFNFFLSTLDLPFEDFSRLLDTCKRGNTTHDDAWDTLDDYIRRKITKDPNFGIRGKYLFSQNQNKFWSHISPLYGFFSDGADEYIVPRQGDYGFSDQIDLFFHGNP